MEFYLGAWDIFTVWNIRSIGNGSAYGFLRGFHRGVDDCTNDGKGNWVPVDLKKVINVPTESQLMIFRASVLQPRTALNKFATSTRLSAKVCQTSLLCS